MQAIPDSLDCPFFKAEQAASEAYRKTFFAWQDGKATREELHQADRKYTEARNTRCSEWSQLGWKSVNERLLEAFFGEQK